MAAEASAQFKLALALVNLDTKIDLDLSDIYVGTPKINEKELLKGILISVFYFEIKRFKEEF